MSRKNLKSLFHSLVWVMLTLVWLPQLSWYAFATPSQIAETRQASYLYTRLSEIYSPLLVQPVTEADKAHPVQSTSVEVHPTIEEQNELAVANIGKRVLVSTTRFPDDIQRILDAGGLRVAMYFEDVPPFFMTTQSGQFIGIDVELARDIAALLGVKVKFMRESKTFDEVVDMVDQRRADVAISQLSNTLHRAMRVRFSNSYVVAYQALLINRLQATQWQNKNRDSRRQPYKMLNRQGVKIGVITGSSYVNFARTDYPKASIVLFDSFDKAVNEVIKGNLMAALYEQTDVRNWHFAHPEGGLNLQTIILKDRKDPLAFAVHRDDEHLLAWLNLYLEKKQADGSLDELLQKYLYSDWHKFTQ